MCCSPGVTYEIPPTPSHVFKHSVLYFRRLWKLEEVGHGDRPWGFIAQPTSCSLYSSTKSVLALWGHTPDPKEIHLSHNGQHALKPSLPPLHGFLSGVIQQPVVLLAVEVK